MTLAESYLKGRMDELQSLLEVFEKEKEEKDIPLYILTGALKLRIKMCKSLNDITEIEVKE